MSVRNGAYCEVVGPSEKGFHADRVYSPPSTYSTYSQEVNFIFDPDIYGEGDYSHIHTNRRNHIPTLPRTSSSSSRVSEKNVIPSSFHAPIPHSMKCGISPAISEHVSLKGWSPSKGWSPPKNMMGTTNSVNGIPRHPSSEKLDAELIQNGMNGHIMEESEHSCPPKLTPISGCLNKTASQGLIRPIAFKPVLSSKYGNTQRNSERRLSSQDEGYGSQDYQIGSHNVSTLSNGFSHHSECDRSFVSESLRPADRPSSLSSNNLNVSQMSSSQIEGFVQSPSPSDSGVGELEALLREKDAELFALRDVMDKNERAIFQVYEEKKGAWINEIRHMRESFDRKMKTLQRKAYKTEQMLSTQINKLQQDCKQMQGSLEKTHQERDTNQKKLEAYEEEIRKTKPQFDQFQYQIHRKNDEIEQLRHQISDLTDKLSLKSTEVLALQAKIESNESEIDTKNQQITAKHKEILVKNEEVRSLKTGLHRWSSCSINGQLIDSCVQTESPVNFVNNNSKSPVTMVNNNNNNSLAPVAMLNNNNCLTPIAMLNSNNSLRLSPGRSPERDQEVKTLGEELNKVSAELHEQKQFYETEKEKWLDEKGKVIRYQKQLQLNYVQMYRKNRTLEAEVEQLTIELEARDMKLLALNGEESAC